MNILGSLVAILVIWTGMVGARRDILAQTQPQPTLSQVPFVGCDSDGQAGPPEAPKPKVKKLALAAGIADRLAYYQAQEGFGVLAPRGWDCFSTYGAMRNCGDEVREVLHDGCPTACFGDAPFAYVNIFTSHVNVGFFHGASLPDPACLLQGNGKFMRHAKLRPGTPTEGASLNRLIQAAYADIKARVDNG